MPETPIDPIESQIAQREEQVAVKEKQVSILRDIVYVPGFENKAATVPIVENLPGRPLNLVFSWGKEAANMSTAYVDESNGETAEGNRQNMEAFLEEHGFDGSPNLIHVIGKFQGLQQQIEEVDSEYKYEGDDPKRDSKDIEANFVITRDRDITMVIKPADCPVIVIYAKDKGGNPMVIIDHCGREAVNAGMTRQGVMYLADKYGVDLSTAVAAIMPGMAKENYFITDDPERWGNSIVERNWGPYIDPKNDDPSKDKELGVERNDAGIQKRHVDMTRAAIMQLLEAGFDPKNVQAYDVDSFEAAKNGEAYSHRFTNDFRGGRKGRFMIAVKLKAESAEKDLPQKELLAA